jgi:hypothetical protein
MKGRQSQTGCQQYGFAFKVRRARALGARDRDPPANSCDALRAIRGAPVSSIHARLAPSSKTGRPARAEALATSSHPDPCRSSSRLMRCAVAGLTRRRGRALQPPRPRLGSTSAYADHTRGAGRRASAGGRASNSACSPRSARSQGEIAVAREIHEAGLLSLEDSRALRADIAARPSDSARKILRMSFSLVTAADRRWRRRRAGDQRVTPRPAKFVCQQIDDLSAILGQVLSCQPSPRKSSVFGPARTSRIPAPSLCSGTFQHLLKSWNIEVLSSENLRASWNNRRVIWES